MVDFLLKKYANKTSIDWRSFLDSEFSQPYMLSLNTFLANEFKRNKTIFPDKKDIFRVFEETPFEKVKVVIIGQDPYHGHGQAHGLSFSVKDNILKPPSLKNIFKELFDDIGVEIADHGCLSPWARQGVLLLNSILTVEDKRPGSHRNKGWEKFTDQVIKFLFERKKNLVFVLWGNYASEKGKFIKSKDHLILRSSHPSPLSAYRGFFGSRPFSKINSYLNQHKITPINWSLS